MTEQTPDRQDMIRVSSTHSFFLFVQAVFFERDVNLAKYNREHISACLDLNNARREMYEAAVDYVISLFEDAVNMSIYLWTDEEDTSYAKAAKDVFIQRLSFELPDRLESLFEKLSADTVAAVDKHFRERQTQAGYPPVAFERLDLRRYQLEWSELFAQLATTVVIDRIDKMKLDRKLTPRARKSDRYMETVMEMFDRTHLECLRIRERMTCKLKGVKPFNRFSASVSENVWAWMACIQEDDHDSV